MESGCRSDYLWAYLQSPVSVGRSIFASRLAHVRFVGAAVPIRKVWVYPAGAGVPTAFLLRVPTCFSELLNRPRLSPRKKELRKLPMQRVPPPEKSHSL